MIDAHWLLFLVASTVVIATPGQDMMLVMSRSLAHGARVPGLAFAALTFVIKGPAAVFAGLLSAWFQSRPAALAWLHRCSGIVMLGLALRLALSRRDDP